MSDECDVTVNICTYNRQQLLRPALESVLSQQAGGPRYEVIVVDNNSTDETRQLIESFIARGATNLQYVFEGRQGLSHARNAGVAAARSPILAFTDDDVRVAPDWVATIKRTLDDHPEVECVGGKVLPRWPSPPPAWLTHEHWAPVAIVDYGEKPFYVNTDHQLCLMGANVAIRKQTLQRVGGFLPDLQRVENSIGSMEDHELLLRLWNVQAQGLYVPELIVSSEIAPNRLTKQYHRRWRFGHGGFYALARIEEFERSRSGYFLGVPHHLCRTASLDAVGWLASVVRGDLNRAFTYETRLRFFAGFFKARGRDWLRRRNRGPRPARTAPLADVQRRRSS
jgi:glucosyl-dolichyl phosphate glucuronosyltransferase